MPSIDMPLEQMRQYKPTLYREADFQEFWESTAREAVDQPLNNELIPYDLPTSDLQCYAVRFDGYKGGRLAGWYVRPTKRGKFPGVVIYHGYSGRGARPLDMIHIAAQGVWWIVSSRMKSTRERCSRGCVMTCSATTAPRRW